MTFLWWPQNESQAPGITREHAMGKWLDQNLDFHALLNTWIITCYHRKLWFPSKQENNSKIFYKLTNIDPHAHCCSANGNINSHSSHCGLVTPHCVTLTHWGWMTQICISKITIIGSHNGLSPGRHQTIIWTNAVILTLLVIYHHWFT